MKTTTNSTVCRQPLSREAARALSAERPLSREAARVLSVLMVLMLLTGMLDATPGFARIKSKKYWGKGVTDAKLNKLNGRNYYRKLPGIGNYACTGYAEWALNKVYKVKKRVPSYPLVRHLRQCFIRRKNKIVAYGNYVSKKRGGDGKIRQYGKIEPGDVVFFFSRNANGKKVKKKAIGKTYGEKNTHGTHQWTHVAIIGGKGSGVNAKLHHNNKKRNVHFGGSIAFYLKTRKCTDYQVFRVLSKRPPAKAVIDTAVPETDSVKVTWKKAARAKHYLVQYREASASKWKTAKKRTAKLSFVIKGLEPETEYRIRIRGIAGKKKGKFSKVRKVRTKEIPEIEESEI